MSASLPRHRLVGDARITSEMSVVQADRWLVASFSCPVRACSWAIVRGGLVEAQHVAWLEVRDHELRPPVDATELLRARLRERRLESAIGLLTSRNVSTYRDVTSDNAGIRVRCIATTGLGNALRAGDPPGVSGRIGTINLLLHVDTPLTDVALLEASAIATEAKTAAVLEAGISSRRSNLPATGTGTDCTVVTCKRPQLRRKGATYAGKHTQIGALIGAAAFQAVQEGIAAWLQEQRP
ncbi:MAG TPA: adenosylcobinamide amidohydrolase [Polyangiaceae bacterium]|nr:adenosylcobinamide amidohydrolase [Polyangiaceae bacterium]